MHCLANFSIKLAGSLYPIFIINVMWTDCGRKEDEQRRKQNPQTCNFTMPRAYKITDKQAICYLQIGTFAQSLFNSLFHELLGSYPFKTSFLGFAKEKILLRKDSCSSRKSADQRILPFSECLNTMEKSTEAGESAEYSVPSRCW